MQRLSKLARLRRWAGALIWSVAALWLAAAPASAQCVLCYTSAAASGTRGINALKLGIVVLLVPTFLMFGAILYFTLRRRAGSSEWPPDSAGGPEGIAAAVSASADDGRSPDRIVVAAERGTVPQQFPV